MKTLTIRLPDMLISEIEQESQSRRISKSDVVRERLQNRPPSISGRSMKAAAGDLLGSVQGLPANLSSNRDKYLPDLIRAKKHHRR